jgi:hypothetical protein
MTPGVIPLSIGSVLRSAILGVAPFLLLTFPLATGEGIGITIYSILGVSQSFLGIMMPATGAKLNGNEGLNILSFALGLTAQLASIGGFGFSFVFGAIADWIAA